MFDFVGTATDHGGATLRDVRLSDGVDILDERGDMGLCGGAGDRRYIAAFENRL